MTHSVRDNSLEAYYELKATLNIRQDEILSIIEKYPLLTDREILTKYGGREMNEVRPRITELIKKGLVKEAGDSKCQITGRTVRILQAVDFNHPEQMQLQI